MPPNATQEIVQDSDKSILYKTGAAFLDMRKNGDITMKGKKIDIKASGDLVMKAAKIMQN